jgi:hypothetical protein
VRNRSVVLSVQNRFPSQETCRDIKEFTLLKNNETGLSAQSRVGKNPGLKKKPAQWVFWSFFGFLGYFWCFWVIFGVFWVFWVFWVFLPRREGF